MWVGSLREFSRRGKPERKEAFPHKGRESTYLVVTNCFQILKTNMNHYSRLRDERSEAGEEKGDSQKNKSHILLHHKNLGVIRKLL